MTFRHKVLPKKFVIEVWYTGNKDVCSETFQFLDQGSHRVVYINTTQGGRVIAQDEPVEKRTVIKTVSYTHLTLPTKRIV